MNKMDTTTLIGLPSSFFVYTIASASSMEAIVFITLYAQIINNISSHIVYITVTDISTFALVLNSIRFVIAIVVFIGQYKETIKTLTVFLGFTFVGVLANIVVGVIGMQDPNTSRVSIATFSVTVLHIMYLVIGVCIFKMNHKRMLADLPRMPLVPDHVPHAIPVETTISVLPTGPSPQVVPVQQYFHNPNMTPAPDMSHSYVPPPPPSYDESTPPRAIAEFPSKKW